MEAGVTARTRGSQSTSEHAVVALHARELTWHIDNRVSCGAERVRTVDACVYSSSTQDSTADFDMDALQRLRAETSEDQREALHVIWRAHLETGKAIPRREIESEYGGRSALRALLEPLGGHVVCTVQAAGPDPAGYSITLLGALLSSSGEQLEEILTEFLRYVCRRLRADFRLQTIASADLVSSGMFSADAADVVHRLLTLHSSRLRWGGTFAADHWTVNVPEEIDDVLEVSDLAAEVRRIAMDDYDPACPIDSDQKLQYVLRKRAGAGSETEFDFVMDAALRKQLQLDWQEARSVFKVKAWKACVLLCGSVFEGILYDAMSAAPETANGDGLDRAVPRGATLGRLLRVAEKKGILKGAMVPLGQALREFRNLIHPARQLELRATVTEHTATIALHQIEILTAERRRAHERGA